jgi:hypothetical protein
MCSCSGSCNCNSTTIPKGPAGPIGPIGEKGANGADGFDGINGKNAFTTLKENFQQPASSDNDSLPTTIKVVDAAWIAIGQIIYIGKTISSLAGGYYRVLDKNMGGDITAVSVIRLSWVIPNESFVVNPNSVLIGSPITPAGTIGANGTNGTGTPGNPGINAFTTTIASFPQPAVNANTPQLYVSNNSWIGIGQILYVWSNTDIGGFYQLVSKSGVNAVVFKRLDWTIPNITFVNNLSTVPAYSNVSPSGSKGADGSTGLSYLQEAKWGNSTGDGGANDFKTSIAVPGGTLVTDEDVLECQTIFKVLGNIPDATYVFYIKVGVSESNTDATAIQFNIPIVNAFDATNSYMINMNYKIQKVGSAGFRSKGECFVSEYKATPTIIPYIFRQTIAQSFLCNSTGSISLASSNWINELFVSVLVDDFTPSRISVTHHEVKVVKIKV